VAVQFNAPDLAESSFTSTLPALDTRIMTTYFQPTDNDAEFVAQINDQFPEPDNQPYLYYLFAGKKFYQEVMSKSPEELLLHAESVILAYKDAFQSKYSLEELTEKSSASTALLGGSLTVVFAIRAHSLEMEINDNTLSVSQGPYAMQLVFDEEHNIHDLKFHV